jgi:hypothetical protein
MIYCKQLHTNVTIRAHEQNGSLPAAEHINVYSFSNKSRE